MKPGYLDHLESILQVVQRSRGPIGWVWTGSRRMPEHWAKAVTLQLDAAQRILGPRDCERVTIAHGDCGQGLDRAVDKLAREHGFRVRRFPVRQAEWNVWGGYAGHQRNARMLDGMVPGLVSAFIYEGSRGSTGCRDNALARGVPCVVISGEDDLALPRLPLV
jgi:hypothetical protein